MNIIETNLSFTSMSKRSKTEQIILHHSGVNVLQSVEVIHNYHKNTNGWAGIGYHFYVRKDGSIYRGRPEDTVGAHAYGSNSDSIGICFEGDFNQEKMGEAQLKAGQELVTYLKEKYGITIVKGHRDVCQTSCPGTNFPFAEIANAKEASSTTITATTKSNEEIADEVIRGDWGNGEDRKNRLVTSGYAYDVIQSIVNAKLSGKTTTASNTKSNEEIANEVIRGDWGNGEDRKNRLVNAGYDYNAIQRIVNAKLK